MKTLISMIYVLGLLGLTVEDANCQAIEPILKSYFGSSCGSATEGGYSTVWSGYHTGDDYLCNNNGRELRTIAFGRVKFTNHMQIACVSNCAGRPDHGMGNIIEVTHMLTDGVEVTSSYNHLDSLHSLLVINEYVSNQQALGYLGATGQEKRDYWSPAHLHFEMKKNPRGGGVTSPWGYSKTAPSDFGYLNPVDYFEKKQVLLPFFLLNTDKSPSKDAYDVYGIANENINFYLNLTGTVQESSIVVRNFTQRRNIEVKGSLNDNLRILGGKNPGEKYPGGYVNGLAGQAKYAEGNYLFAANVVDVTGKNGFGYPVEFSFVKNGDIIVDNDQKNADANTGNDATSESVYNGTRVSPPLPSSSIIPADGSKIPGYFLTADLFPGKSDAFAQWKPNAANTYRIYVHVPEHGATAIAVRYKIKPDGLNNIISRPINQKNAYIAFIDGWVPLEALDGTRIFSFTKNGFVGLSLGSTSSDANYAGILGVNDATSTDRHSPEYVAFDAVKFESVVSTSSEEDTLLNTSHQTSWAYFRDPNMVKWYITDAVGLTYALGQNSKKHSAWVSIGNGENVAALDFLSRKISVKNDTKTSTTTYTALSLVGGEGEEWMKGSAASQWANRIEGATMPAEWYFFKVKSSGIWYIVETDRESSKIYRLNLTYDNSNYDWKRPLDATGGEINTSGWKKNFYQEPDGRWMVNIIK